jgi:hypothetical protein
MCVRDSETNRCVGLMYHTLCKRVIIIGGGRLFVGYKNGPLIIIYQENKKISWDSGFRYIWGKFCNGRLFTWICVLNRSL